MSSPSPPSASAATGGGFSPSSSSKKKTPKQRPSSSTPLVRVARTHPLLSAVALALVGMQLALLFVSFRVVDEYVFQNNGDGRGGARAPPRRENSGPLRPPASPERGGSGEASKAPPLPPLRVGGVAVGGATTSKGALSKGGGSRGAGGGVPSGRVGGDEVSDAIAVSSEGGSSPADHGGESVAADAEEVNSTPHRHAIPNIVTFTHYVDLLNHTGDFDDPEDAVLAANVRNILALHPGAEVHFLTDPLCVDAIRAALAPSSSTTAEKLVKFFLKEKKGMYKADICRGAALYNTGGLYFDVDIQARMDVFSVLPPHVEFVTPKVHSKSKVVGSFFQAFIGVTPRHPVMRRYLEMFVEYYEGKREVKGALGVVLLRKAYDDTPSLTVENSALWQEVRYDPKYFPDVEPTSGKRRACHFLVAIPGTHTAVFYSRVRGSRMCGGRHSNLKGNEDIGA